MIMRYRRINAFLWWGGYQLVDEFQYQTAINGHYIDTHFIALDLDGTLTLKKWFIWDGPTGAIKTRKFVAGSAIHDGLCDLINMGLLPKFLQCMVDEEMLKVNRSQKMHKIRRGYTYGVVRWYQLRKKSPFSPRVYEIEV